MIHGTKLGLNPANCSWHLSTDAQTHTFMREIPQCWVTGQAAGAAAALAANAGITAAEVDIRALQAVLLRQGAYLRPPESS